MEVVFSDTFTEQLIGMSDEDKKQIEKFVNLLKTCQDEKDVKKQLKALKKHGLD